jgi:hypothetical protein
MPAARVWSQFARHVLFAQCPIGPGELGGVVEHPISTPVVEQRADRYQSVPQRHVRRGCRFLLRDARPEEGDRVRARHLVRLNDPIMIEIDAALLDSPKSIQGIPGCLELKNADALRKGPGCKVHEEIVIDRPADGHIPRERPRPQAIPGPGTSPPPRIVYTLTLRPMTTRAATSSLVQSAEEFVREQQARVRRETERPYHRDGAHVTVGREKPLAPDFAPSGSTVPAK